MQSNRFIAREKKVKYLKNLKSIRENLSIKLYTIYNKK